MEKSCRNYAPKASPRSFILINSHRRQEIILKVRCFERGLSKSLEKVNFIFSYKPGPF